MQIDYPPSSLSASDFPPSFLQALENTLKQLVRAKQLQQWSILASLPLASTELVTSMLTSENVVTSSEIGLATYALLEWGIDKLRPVGIPDWNAYPWRAYLVLYHGYLQDVPFARLAEQLGISEQTVYQSRRTALNRLAEIVNGELLAPQEATLRKLYFLGCRYASLSSYEQTIIRMLAVLNKPQSLDRSLSLLCWATEQSEAQVQLQVQRLLASAILQQINPSAALSASDADLPDTKVTEEFCQYLCTMRSSEVTDAHAKLAAYYARNSEWWSAVSHYQQAGDRHNAAGILLAQYQIFINDGQIGELLTQLQTFSAPQLDEIVWAKIKLLAGDLAMLQQDVQVAVREYQQALRVDHVELRAQAYYKRARAFLSLNLDEALLHYEMASEALTHFQDNHPLRVRIQCDHAWFYIQEKPDLPKAQSLLQQVAASLHPADKLGLSYLANAWAGLHHRQGKNEIALQERLRSWLLANEAQDLEWMMHTGRNVGNDYVELKQYTTALEYYEHSLKIAIKIGDKAMLAMANKAMGECHFWQRNYEQAIVHYQSAYALLHKVKRLHWLVHICYDLTEVYAQMWMVDEMNRHADEGRALCLQLRNHKLYAQIDQIAAELAWMQPLHDRQRSALSLVMRNGAISNREYQLLTNCAQRQAVRDLNELCDLEILQRQGQGRSVRYIRLK